MYTKKIQVTSGILYGIPCTRERCITVLHHARANIVGNTINAMGQFDIISSNIQWLSCNLIGCIFYDMI